MSIFSGRHFPKDVILWAVRWYCRYGVSYHDLEEMLTERGVAVDHTTWKKPYSTRGVLAMLGVGLACLPHSGHRTL